MNYDSWLEQPYQDQYDEDDKIDSRVEELMEEDYNPNDFNNFVESISEASKDDIETIEDYLQRKEYDKLGLKLWAICYERMEKQATNHAVENLNSGYLD